MSIYFLYKKTHRITGLQYLGQTSYNPFTYKGSGKRWKSHLRKHGNDVHTEVLGIFDCKSMLREAGLFYSHMWKIVESDEWANLCVENADGVIGYKHTGETKKIIGKYNKLKVGKKRSDEAKQKMRLAKLGKKLSEEHKTNLRGRTISEEHKRKIIESNKSRKGRKNTQEAIARMSTVKLGRKHSEEHRAAQSAGHQRRRVNSAYALSPQQSPSNEED